jgi:phosphoserine aminotransferase
MAPSSPVDAGWNFSAGPAMLPRTVLARIREDLPDYAGSGQSVLELPFGGAHYQDIAARAEQALRALLSMPSDYAVLFLQGGASAQFALLPLNLMGEREVADYVETGYWSAKCIAEAGRYCRVNVAASSAGTGYDRVPEPAVWSASPGAAYLHITGNETANGVEYPWTPVRLRTPLVADVSSSFLTRPLDLSDYGAIYASAQKNIGPAGLTVVIVNRALFERERPLTPAVFSYRRQAEAGSRLNTPPTFAVYVAGLVFDWIAAQGGLEAMEAASRDKSERVYRAIDGSEGFYRGPVLPAFRSRVNVCFRMREDALTPAFVAQAQVAGLFNLQGHSKVGGLRASLYNAMPLAGADALAGFMRDFAQRHG